GGQRGDRAVEAGPLAALRVGEDQVEPPERGQQVQRVADPDVDPRRPAGFPGEGRGRALLLDRQDARVGAPAQAVHQPGGPGAGAGAEFEDAPVRRYGGAERGEESADRRFAGEPETVLVGAVYRLGDAGRESDARWKIGAPFYVMEYVDGVVLRDPSRRPSLKAAARCAELLVDLLVKLHSINPDAVGLADFGRPDGYLLRQVRRWHKQWEASKTRELP